MNIEFIKWLFEKAEGYEYEEYGFIRTPDNYFYEFLSENRVMRYYTIDYPLLLQRAIEGVNRDSDYWIWQTPCKICITDRGEGLGEILIEYNPEEKESALLYIYEQELNK